MNLLELQRVLGERIAIANDMTISPERRKKEAEISMTISSLAKQMINNADVVLRAEKLVAEGKLQNSTIEKMVKEDAITVDGKDVKQIGADENAETPMVHK